MEAEYTFDEKNVDEEVENEEVSAIDDGVEDDDNVGVAPILLPAQCGEVQSDCLMNEKSPDSTALGNAPTINEMSKQGNPILSPTKTFEWEKPSWTCAKLRSTGKNLKIGEDLQGPITHVEKRYMDDLNFEANPLLLRPTKQGVDVRLGDNLAKPITHCEKDPQSGMNPLVSTQVLKNTERGQQLIQGVDLQAPITHVQKDTMDDINFEANPLVLKSTEKGQEVRLGVKLERPITFINRLSNRED